MEVSASTPTVSLLLPSFAGHGAAEADQRSEEGEVGQPRSRWHTFALLLGYARCFQEHKSGSIVSVTRRSHGKTCSSVRYRCAGCGLLWSPRWRR